MQLICIYCNLKIHTNWALNLSICRFCNGYQQQWPARAESECEISINGNNNKPILFGQPIALYVTIQNCNGHRARFLQDSSSLQEQSLNVFWRILLYHSPNRTQTTLKVNTDFSNLTLIVVARNMISESPFNCWNVIRTLPSQFKLLN